MWLGYAIIVGLCSMVVVTAAGRPCGAAIEYLTGPSDTYSEMPACKAAQRTRLTFLGAMIGIGAVGALAVAALIQVVDVSVGPPRRGRPRLARATPDEGAGSPMTGDRARHGTRWGTNDV